MSEQTETDEHSLMMAMKLRPDASIGQLAEHLRWMGKTGQPQKSKVHGILKHLARGKLVEQLGQRWALTTKGARVLNAGKSAPAHDPAAALKAKFRMVE
jgi:DNA-binding IclR family transcriptional regulator